MDVLTFFQWLCCGWTCLKECCECCGPPNPNLGEVGGSNGPQKIWIKKKFANFPEQCMCCLGPSTCCVTGGANVKFKQEGKRKKVKGTTNSRPSDKEVHQSTSEVVGSNNNNSSQVLNETTQFDENGKIQDKQVGVGSNNNNSLQMLKTNPINGDGQIQGGNNYGTQQIFKDTNDVYIVNHYPAPNDRLDEQSKNINKSNSINPEIIGSDNEIECNISLMHHSKSELDLDVNINPKIIGTGNRMKLNIASIHRWNSYPEDHVHKEIVEKFKTLSALNWAKAIEEEKEPPSCENID